MEEWIGAAGRRWSDERRWAPRLRNFAWFSMEHASTAPEYERFLSGLLAWLFEGTPRQTGGTR